VDARVGGRFEVHMLTPDGTLLPSVGTFHEVSPYDRIVFDSNLVDADGNKLIEVVNTVTLKDAAGKTHMHLHVKVLKAAPQIADKLGTMEQGWTESLERFEAEIIRVRRTG
jgi:uncharacterized protein YndB with AHSA1/START domain